MPDSWRFSALNEVGLGYKYGKYESFWNQSVTIGIKTVYTIGSAIYRFFLTNAYFVNGNT